MEPHTSHPGCRLAAITALKQAELPAGVLVALVIQGFTEHELPAIITAATHTGPQYTGYRVLRLPYTVGPLFEQWLSEHMPTKKAKILKHLQTMHGRQLHNPRFRYRMLGEGIYAEQMAALFAVVRRKSGLRSRSPMLSTAAFRRSLRNATGAAEYPGFYGEG